MHRILLMWTVSALLLIFGGHNGWISVAATFPNKSYSTSQKTHASPLLDLLYFAYMLRKNTTLCTVDQKEDLVKAVKM